MKWYEKKKAGITRTLKQLIAKLKRLKIVQPVKGSNSSHKDTPTNRRKSGRGRFLRVKNAKRLLMATGIVVVAALAVILTVTLIGNASQVAVAEEDLIAAKKDLAIDDTTSLSITETKAHVSFAMPAYTTVSIYEGMEATVIMTLQSRLMNLDYMDMDEPDGVYDEASKVAVERFQAQHELTVTGVVDQQTYDLLMSDEAKYYTITIGAKDIDVSELQQRLYELDYIGKDKTTGYFGTDTEAAVMKFQKLNGLSEDGKVGKNTREMLYSEDAVPNMCAYGEQSPEILSYQQRLKKLGYLTTEPDGTFGDDTKAAVRRFQESSGLISDGYIGPTTKAALLSDDAQGNALAIGAKGDDVTRVQERLKELGYTKKVTGYFGSDTDAAVKEFQNTNKLSVDGKVGAQTMNTLTSSSAKKYKKPASSGGGGSSGGGSSGGGSSDGGSSDDDDGASANITGANVESFISVAESKIGKKYVRGAKGPNSFDCSGFVYWCLNQVGVNQGYMTSRTWAKSTKYNKITSMSDMVRGDIIVYSGHVAIYAGDGVMIDASSRNRKVVKRSSTSSWCRTSFICAFRVF